MIKTRSVVPAEPPVSEVWERFLELARAKPSIAALAETLRLESLAGGVATLRASSAESLESARPRSVALAEILSAVVGRTLRVELSAEQSTGTSVPALAGGAAPIDAAARAQAMNHPLVRRAVELLGAKLIGVEEDPGSLPPRVSSPGDGGT